jgi:hypothetical protein
MTAPTGGSVHAVLDWLLFPQNILRLKQGLTNCGQLALVFGRHSFSR